MTDREIRDKLKAFSEEILSGCSRAKAKEIDKRLNEFCSQNNVTVEQMNILAESGAGEMLYMLTS